MELCFLRRAPARGEVLATWAVLPIAALGKGFLGSMDALPTLGKPANQVSYELTTTNKPKQPQVVPRSCDRDI